MTVPRDWGRTEGTFKVASVIVHQLMLEFGSELHRVRGCQPIFGQMLELQDRRLLGQEVAPVAIHLEIRSMPGLEGFAQGLEIRKFIQFDPVASPVVLLPGRRSRPSGLGAFAVNDKAYLLHAQRVAIAANAPTQDDMWPEVPFLNAVVWNSKLMCGQETFGAFSLERGVVADRRFSGLSGRTALAGLASQGPCNFGAI